MDWYMAKIIYRIVCGEGDHKPQFDEQLRLIRASDAKEAFEKAQHIGVQQEFSFLNQKQQTVQWQFINTAEIYKLPGLNDGAELYSHVHEADHAGMFIDLVNKKADNIRTSYAVELTTELI